MRKMPLKAPESYDISYTAPPAIGKKVFFKPQEKFSSYSAFDFTWKKKKKKKVNHESVPRWESETRAAGA